MQRQDAAGASKREARQLLPRGLPAHLVLPGGERAFVTLRTSAGMAPRLSAPARCASIPAAWACSCR